MMGKTKKMDRGFLVSVGTPETAMSPDPKYALLSILRYSKNPPNGFAQSKYGWLAAEDLAVHNYFYRNFFIYPHFELETQVESRLVYLSFDL